MKTHYTITDLPAASLQLIILALSKAPYEVSADTIHLLQAQRSSQDQSETMTLSMQQAAE